MATSVYYKESGTTTYYTNQNKSDYTLGNAGEPRGGGNTVVLEMYNGKFVFPENSKGLLAYCTNTSFDTSYWDFSEAKSLEALFMGCEKMTTLVINHEPYSGNNIENVSAMFRDCIKLTSVQLTTLSGARPTTMEKMFYNCKSLVYYDVIGSDWSQLETTESMFEDCEKLTEIQLTDATKKATNLLNCRRMFWGCFSLEKITIGNLCFENVIDCAEMFYFCSSLTQLGWDPTFLNCKYASFMFGNCKSLTSISFLNAFESPQNVSYMFGGCENLRGVGLQKLRVNAVTDTSGMFAGDTNLQRIFVPNETDWEELINYSYTLDSTDMFKDCTKLPNGDGVTDITRANNTKGGYFGGRNTWLENKTFIKENGDGVEVNIFQKDSGTWKASEVQRLG